MCNSNATSNPPQQGFPDSQPTEARRCSAAVWMLRGAAAVAGVALASLWIPAPSERFYAIVPILYALDAVCYRRPSRRRRLAGCAVAGGLVAGVAIVETLAPNGILQPYEMTVIGYACLTVYCVSAYLLKALKAGAARLFGIDASTPGPKRLAVRLGVIVVFALLIHAYLFALMQTHWPKRCIANTPKQLHLAYENIALVSRDGTRLAGWFVPAPDASRTAVVCHGVGAYKADMLEFIYALHQASFNVVAIDFRGHGESGGHTVTYGTREKEDIFAVLDYLERDHATQAEHIVGVGWSMGAASLILAAAEDPRIEALHIDAAYARTFDIARVIASPLPPVVNQTGLYLGTALAYLETSTNLFTLAPVEAIGKIAPRPVMLIHGTHDRMIPVDQGRRLFAAASEPKQFIEIEGAGHCGTLSADSPAHEARMTQFLIDAVKGEP